VSRDSIRKIVQAANEKGMHVRISSVYLYADAMGKSGSDADSYLKMVQHNAAALAENLSLNGG
jgi:manganese/zinc/iron transport system substrate-binding protein